MYTIQVQKRESDIRKSTTRGLYRDGRIPCVIYDGSGQSVPVSMDQKDAEVLIRKRGVSGLIQVDIEGDKSVTAIFKNLQYNHMRTEIRHVDFQVTEDDKPVKIRVPVKGNGTPFGVLRQGGVLQQNAQDTEICCLPKDIPDFIAVDVSNLKLNEIIRARDIEGFNFSLPLQSFFTVASSRAARKMASSQKGA